MLAASISQWPDHHKPFYLTGREVITDAQLLCTAAEVIDAQGVTFPVPQAVIQMLSLILDAIPSWREAVPSLGRDRVREILPDRWVCDGGRFVEVFDWQPRKGLSETLRATAEWLKINRAI